MHGQTGAPASRIRFKNGREGAFYNAVRSRVQDHFAHTGRTRFADGFIWTKGGIYFSIALAAYALILFGGLGPWSMLALANVYGIGALLLAINVGHDGAHAALSRHKWINQAALYSSFS